MKQIKLAPAGLHRDFMRRFQHDNDLYINCIEFVHLLLFKTGVTDLKVFKSKSEEQLDALLIKTKQTWNGNTSKFKAGDIVFTMKNNGNDFCHVSIYIGKIIDNLPEVIQLGYNHDSNRVNKQKIDLDPGESLHVVPLEDIVKHHIGSRS